MQDALAARNLTLARATPDEARASREQAEQYPEKLRQYEHAQTTAAAGRYAGLEPEIERPRYTPALDAGELVAVDRRGHVYKFDERTTGQFRNEIEQRLAGIDALPSVTEAKEAQLDASRAEWREQQRAAWEKQRPATAIERAVIDCWEKARERGATVPTWQHSGEIAARVDAFADLLKPETERQTEFSTVHGDKAFAARLDEAGIAIARVTAADAKALDALREEESMKLLQRRHFADLEAGELAAVTRAGDVYRINPDKLGDAKQHLPAELPGVIETRAKFEIERGQISAVWNEQRADIATARADFAAERESQAQHAQTVRDVRAFNQEVGEAVDTGFKASGGFLRGLSSMAESFIETLSNILFPPPPPTRDQAERMARSAEEKQQANEQTAQTNERAEAQHWLVEEARRRAAEKEAGRSPESERPKEPDRGYERERF